MLETHPELRLSRSWTTRPRRSDESADAYAFVDRPTFEKRVAERGFLEWTEFAGTGHLYGTPTFENDAGEIVLLEIELDGAQQVKAARPDAVVIFVVAPSAAEREARLRARGDDEASVARRMEVGAAEEALGTRFADHVVVNDDVDRAVDEVAGILAARREQE